MDINHLEADEIDVEFRVRQIEGNYDEKIVKLRESVSNEEELSFVNAPSRPHNAAYRAPKTEILRCREKLVEIKGSIADAMSADKVDVAVLKPLSSRLVHVYSRLFRMGYSPSVGEEARQMQVSVSKLIAVIANWDNESDKDQFLVSTNEIEIFPLSADFAKEEEGIIRQFEKVKASSPVKQYVSLNYLSLSATTIPSSAENTGTPIAGQVATGGIQAITNNFPTVTSGNLCQTAPGPPSASNPRPHEALASQCRNCPSSMNTSIVPPVPMVSSVYSSHVTSAPMYSFQPPAPVTISGHPHSTFESVINEAVSCQHCSPPVNMPIVSPTSVVSSGNPHKVSFVPTYTLPPPASVTIPSRFEKSNIPPETSIHPFRPSFANRAMNLNIHYDGSKNAPPIERFFFRVEHLANSFGIRRENLVAELHFVLRGIALEWYWSCLERYHGWVSFEDLKALMLERFQDRRTDFDIRRTIDGRKQKKGESFIDFYSEIQNLSLPLRKELTENELLMILVTNMNVDLQSKLAGETFCSVASLLNKCVAIEDVWSRINKIPVVVGINRRVDEVNLVKTDHVPQADPDEEYLVHNLDAMRFGRHDQSSRNKYGPQNPQDGPRKPTEHFACWNCQETGHSFKDCPAGRIMHVFCFGCGAPDTYRPSCRNCISKSENLRRVATTSGDHRFPQRTPQPKPERTDSASNTDPEFYRLLQRPN